MDYSAKLIPLSAPSPKYHHFVYCRSLGHFFWAFCLFLLLGLTPAFGQSLEDLSNHTHPLTTPSLVLLPIIKISEVILPINILQWANKNN
jgi:hypothetical protein